GGPAQQAHHRRQIAACCSLERAYDESGIVSGRAPSRLRVTARDQRLYARARRRFLDHTSESPLFRHQPQGHHGEARAAATGDYCLTTLNYSTLKDRRSSAGVPARTSVAISTTVYGPGRTFLSRLRLSEAGTYRFG